MMKKTPARFLYAFLCLFACSAALIPFVTAAACDNPEYPHAEFLMRYANNTDTGRRVVIFTDQSEAPAGQPIVWRRWYFGDGYISEDQNPVHTYYYYDHYTVRLVVQTSCGERYSDEYRDEQTQELDTYCPRPVASFTGDVFEGSAPLTVHFTDTSEHADPSVTAWTYTFGDSVYDPVQAFRQNPVHTFNTTGVYTIHQTVKKSCNPIGDESTLQIRVKPAVLGIFFYINATNTTAATTTAVTAAVTTAAATTVTAVPAAATSRVPVATVTTVMVPGTPVPGTGTLSVTTDPAGATVYVDDVMRGASPAVIPGLAAGTHTLRLERAGYRTMGVPVTIDDGKTTEYATALIPESYGGKTPLGAAAAVLACAGAGLFVLMRKKTL
jgi:PKD repeat protein